MDRFVEVVTGLAGRGDDSLPALIQRQLNIEKENIMPRRKRMHMIEVKQWEPVRRNWPYPGRIRSAVIEGAPEHLRVEIVNLDPRELDRVHTVNLLPLPARPHNRTWALLVAAGIDAKVGAHIDPKQLVNRIVGFRLREEAVDNCEDFDFEPIPELPGDGGNTSTVAEKEIRPAKRD